MISAGAVAGSSAMVSTAVLPGPARKARRARSVSAPWRTSTRQSSSSLASQSRMRMGLSLRAGRPSSASRVRFRGLKGDTQMVQSLPARPSPWGHSMNWMKLKT